MHAILLLLNNKSGLSEFGNRLHFHAEHHYGARSGSPIANAVRLLIFQFAYGGYFSALTQKPGPSCYVLPVGGETARRKASNLDA